MELEPTIVAEFVEHVSGNGNAVPYLRDNSVCFDCDGTIMGKWWYRASRPDGCIATDAEVKAIIEGYAPLWEIYVAKYATRDSARNLAEPMVTKAKEFVEYFSENGNAVPKTRDKSVCFDCDGTIMGKWWDTASEDKGCIANLAKAEHRMVTKANDS